MNKDRSKLITLLRFAAPFDPNVRYIDFFKKAFGVTTTPEQVKKWLDTNRQYRAIFEPSRYYKWKNYYRRDVGLDEYIYISSTPQIDEGDFDLVEVNKPVKIEGVESIPTFYLLRGKLFDPGQTIPADLSHYYFIYETFVGLEIISSMNEFISIANDNKVTFDKILGQCQNAQPKFLGKGSDGTALDIGPDKVLKFFKTAYAFDEAIKARQRLNGKEESPFAKYEARLYDAGKIKINTNKGSYFIYYWIIEKMDMIDKVNPTLGKYIKEIVNYLDGGDIRVFENKFESENFKEIKRNIRNREKDYIQNNKAEILQEVKRTVEFIRRIIDIKFAKQIAEIKEECKYMGMRDDAFDKLIEEIVIKNLTNRPDLHAGNLGITNYGLFRYFDPAYGDPEGKVNSSVHNAKTT